MRILVDCCFLFVFFVFFFFWCLSSVVYFRQFDLFLDVVVLDGGVVVGASLRRELLRADARAGGDGRVLADVGRHVRELRGARVLVEAGRLAEDEENRGRGEDLRHDEIAHPHHQIMFHVFLDISFIDQE